MTISRCIITAASNKFFPSLLNLLGSIKANYPGHPHIYVYDLGLWSIFRKELQKIKDVTVLSMPHFVPHWRSCYTWKTHILHTPLAELNLYIDGGSQVLQSLDGLFEKIEKNGYLLVSQGKEVTLREITPPDYVEILDFDKEKLNHEVIAAGIVGFKKGGEIEIVTDKLYQTGITGLCLGFSKGEQWKNKGKNRTSFIRNCDRFRHDTTLFSLFVLKYLKNPTIEPLEDFDGYNSGRSNQFIWSIRMNYGRLQYVNFIETSILTKLILSFFFRMKNIRKWIKTRI